MPVALPPVARVTVSARARRARHVLSWAGALLLLTACGGSESGGTIQPRAGTVSTVRVTPGTASVDVGGGYQLAASALDASGQTLSGKVLSWSSQSPGIATVNGAGLVTGVAAGTATIAVSADGVTGTATMVVALPVAARCDATTPITVPQSVTGSLLATDCRLPDGSYADKYTLTLTESTPLRIAMSGSVDAFLVLQDAATGTIVAENDDGNGDTGARIEQVIPAGRYVILANTFEAATFGDYRLSVSRAQPACLDATPIGTNAAVTGTLAATACQLPDSSYADRYRLTVPSSTILDLTMRSTVLDAFLFVEQDDGTSIQRNDNGGGGRDARISVTLAAGTYFIYANSVGAGETGAYTLTLSSELDPCGVNRTIAIGASITDTLTSSACRLADGSFVRRVGVSVATSTPVRLDLTSTQFDPYLFLQPAGVTTPLAQDDDGGPGLNAQILQVLAPGDYVITVTSATAGETGIYTLGLSGAAAGPVAVAVTPATATLSPGQTQQLTAAVTGATNTSVQWTSATPGVASVSATGVVRAIAAGTTAIVATSAADPSRTASATITVNSTTDTNLDLPLVYLTQSVQTADSRIPLVADRPTVARVFVRGSRSGLGTAPVRVRFYTGSTLLGTITGTAPVATATNEACCSADIVVPATLVRDGVTLVADVDPANVIAETNETDNAWPLTGVSKPLRVVTVPNVRIELVPIRHRTTGQVSDPVPQFTSLLQRMFPLAQVSVTVHAPYVTDTPPLTDANGWLSMLSQIDALRTLEGSSAYYYGVLNQASAPGIVGIAGVGGFSGVGVGGPDSSAQETLTHEFGHSFGRQHSPNPARCGTPAGVDANFPRPDGSIGVYGYDLLRSRVFAPTEFDIMGYCDDTWASEYTYTGVLRYLRSGAIPLTRAAAIEVPVLLLSGTYSNGAVTVEPVFSTTSATPGTGSTGRFVAEGVASDGRVLFRHRFDGTAVSDVDASARTFTVAVPYDPALRGAVARITVTDASGAGAPARLVRAGVYGAAAGGVSLRVDADPQLDVRDAGSGQFTVTWNAARYPAVVVRDRVTRRVLGMGRRGALTISATSLTDLDVMLSDGVSSTHRALAPGGAP